MVRRLDDAIDAAGRSGQPFRRVLNVSGAVTDGPSNGPFDGPVDRWVEDVVTFATAYGFDTFVFAGDLGQLERFAHEVVPAARELVAGERGERPRSAPHAPRTHQLTNLLVYSMLDGCSTSR